MDSVQCSITVGIILNPENCTRRVDRGPTPTTNTSNTSNTTNNNMTEFKLFWGEKCEIRRFKDGAIVESVVWDDFRKNPNFNLVPRIDGIVETIIRYILGIHVTEVCGNNGDKITSVGCKLEQILPCELQSITTTTNTNTISTNNFNNNSTMTKVNNNASSNDSNDNNKQDPRLIYDYKTLCQKAVTGLDYIRTILTSSIKNIPLNIDSLISTASCLRYTSLYPPLPHPILSKYAQDLSLLKLLAGHQVSSIIEPIHVHAIFGHSSKWPVEKDGVDKLITAFILQISKQLKLQFMIYSIAHRSYLDLIYEGFLFRLHFLPQLTAMNKPRPTCVMIKGQY